MYLLLWLAAAAGPAAAPPATAAAAAANGGSVAAAVSESPAAAAAATNGGFGTTTTETTGAQQPDLIATFGSLGAVPRPATRACAGLLNGGPEFGNKFMDPLRMGNYRGIACQNPADYRALRESGVQNIQCDVSQFMNCSGLPTNLSDTSMCKLWPGRGGNWTAWERFVTAVVERQAGPQTSWGVWNEPNDGFWPGCSAEQAGPTGCALPDPAFLEVWRRTVLQIRATDESAVIVGPSINEFSLPFLSTFVDFAVAHKVVPNMLDWHEFSPNGSDIPDHHESMRGWLRAHHPALADIPIGHGETVPYTGRLWAGLTLGALAGAERAGAAFGVHSSWSESGPGWEPQGHYKQCGFEELVTCNDQPPVGGDSTRQPRATYHVYAAYGNTSGVMVPVSRHCDDADAFASYDDGSGTAAVNVDAAASTTPAAATGWLVVGRYEFDPKAGPNRSVHVRLSGLPPTLVKDGQTTVTLAKIPNSLQLAVSRPLPMGTFVHNVTRTTPAKAAFDLDLELVIGTHDVWTVRVLPPTPPPGPPPPPMPCVPPIRCLDAGGNTTLFFTVQTDNPVLCAPAPNSNVSHTIYKGSLCGPRAEKAIQWESMHTVDPRAGMQPSACSWVEPVGSPYTGTCGGCAEIVHLPTHVC